LKETGGVGWSNEGGRGMEMEEKEEVERNPRHLMSPPIIIIILMNRFA